VVGAARRRASKVDDVARCGRDLADLAQRGLRGGVGADSHAPIADDRGGERLQVTRQRLWRDPRSTGELAQEPLARIDCDGRSYGIGRPGCADGDVGACCRVCCLPRRCPVGFDGFDGATSDEGRGGRSCRLANREAPSHHHCGPHDLGAPMDDGDTRVEQGHRVGVAGGLPRLTRVGAEDELLWPECGGGRS